MAKLLIFIFIFFAVNAHADLNHCEAPTPEWKICHDDWWECERRVEGWQDGYVGCVAAQQVLFDILGWGEVQANTGITGYVIPQHPVETAFNDLSFCNDHVFVCLLGEFQFAIETLKCKAALNQILVEQFGL